jgi:hypothetical protein
MTTRRQSIQKMMTIAGAAGATVAITGSAQADQPHMEAAVSSLESALHELERAESDKGGHREKAMRLVRDAISETRAGMRFERRH